MGSSKEKAAGARQRTTRDVAHPLRRLFGKDKEEDLALFAAGLAFYALVSIAPMVIVVLWVASAILGDERVQHAARSLEEFAPRSIGADKALTEVAKLGSHIGFVSLVAGIWPASSYGAGLVRAFDRLSPRPGRNLKGLKGRALALLVLMPLFVLGGLVSSYAGTALLGGEGIGLLAGWVLGLMFGFVGAALALVLVYRIFPPEPLDWRAIRRATLVAGVGVSLLSLGFTVYLSAGANFKDHYATSGIAGVVLLGVWLFLSNVLVLVGYKVALDS